MAGTLYLCATPIGNLEDITFRVLRVLREADLIAAEDTRNSIRLLNYFEIETPMTSYHEYNKFDKGRVLIEKLLEGKDIALITDAGTPGISDPGEELVRMCYEEGITVTAVPGAAACVSALTISGLPTRRFAFEGFLSVNKRHRKEHLELVKNDTHTLIFYEAPHKLKNTLSDMQKTFGGDRKIALVRELTKIHEEVKRCTIDEAIAYYSENNPRGEYVLVVEGAKEVEETEENEWENISIKEHVDKYIAEGMTSKDAIKKAAADRNLPKRDVYNEYHRGE